MNETQFWLIIADAWSDVGGWHQERKQLANGQLPDEKLDALVNSLDVFIPALRVRLQSLTQDDLLAFDRILERKLWDIDRAEIQ